MPVAHKGQQQDKRSDDQNAASFKFANLDASGSLRRRWSNGTHQNIVAPRLDVGASAPPVRGAITVTTKSVV